MIEKSYSATIGDHCDALYRNALLDLGDAPRRQGGAAGPEGLTVDDVANGLTAEHRARIEAVLAPEGKVMTPEAWAELEEIVVDYRIFETAPRPPIPSSERAEALEAAGRGGR